jgi:hypothetical protein
MDYRVGSLAEQDAIRLFVDRARHAEATFALTDANAETVALLWQRVQAEPEWHDRLSEDDRRALTPLFWSNVNHYGRFRLEMERHLDIEAVSPGLPGGPPPAFQAVAE